MAEDRIIIALDVAERSQVEELCRMLSGRVRMLKVGLQLFLAEGPPIVGYIREQGFEVFLDIKLHDIPQQVSLACSEIVKMGVSMFTVHASGGPAMLQGAAAATRDAADRLGVARPRVLAITVLTSLDQQNLVSIGVERNVSDQVGGLAGLALDQGIDGAVASAREVATLRERVGRDFILVTPGIRLETSAFDDQKRTATPAEALAAGADYLVIGRPVTGADDPAEALENIIRQTH